MPARLQIAVPKDYSLERDLCSYGYFLLWPNLWDVRAKVFSRVLTLSSGAVRVTIAQIGGKGSPLRLSVEPKPTPAQKRELLAQIRRMLRLDEDEASIKDFHRLDRRWKRHGRGRLFRSPTLFEDVVKTVTSCNVTWPGTLSMNRRLCEVLGPQVGLAGETFYGFPAPADLAAAKPQTLRARCRVGYRDRRLIELARLFVKGAIDETKLLAMSDADLRAFLLELPGVGPYAAANIMQLLGRYAHLPLDTESVRHGRSLLKFKGSSARVMKRVQKHFAPFGAHAFRSYWFEMWAFYESKHGPAHEWERDTTGKVFTAANLK